MADGFRDLTFLDYNGSVEDRYFYDLPAWPVGETRTLPTEVADRLYHEYSGSFTYSTKKASANPVLVPDATAPPAADKE